MRFELILRNKEMGNKNPDANTAIIDIEKSDQNIPISQENLAAKRLAEMQTQTEFLCNALTVKIQGFDSQDWLEKLREYLKKYGRLLYSNITYWIFCLPDEKFEILSTNLLSVIEYTVSNLSSEDPARKTALKFYDHVNLARHQFVTFSSNEEDLEKLIEKKIEPELSKTTKELTSQLVGLIGIFTALSFIVFGGLDTLGGIFANAEKVYSVLPTLIIILLWTFAMMNFLYAFMYFVMRIVKCLPNTQSKNFVQAHPLICLSNGILISALLVSSAAFYANKHGIGEPIFIFAKSHSLFAFIAGLAAIIFILWKMWDFLHRKCSEKNSD